ncbi:MAG: esterase-like activity of phytase family protein, partial [Ruegeria sp.]|nr:esterase-like activity of phytase family protein [Ruegeria sp.]
MCRRFAIQLIAALLLTGSVGAAEIKQATQLNSFVWRHSEDWFGGFSAVHISENGQNMIALSDRAILLHARIHRDSDQIAHIQITEHWPVLSSKGRPLSGSTGDSEGIAVTPDGTYYISFEAVHRVAQYASPDAKAQVLPRPKMFDDLNLNGSFEALAIDHRGWLYTLPEKSRNRQGDIPVYRWDGQTWSTPFVLPQRGKFLPVAADFGPDGRFYVLERSFVLTGFRTRLRRWRIEGDVAKAEETLFTTSTG